MNVVRFIALAGALLAGGAAGAAGLQVAPVTLTLQANQQADGLWLSNTGGAQLDAQVRVYRWTQVDGQEKLELTRALIVSPPMLQLPVEGRQLVRVIRSGPPPIGTAEEAYRVLIDELPPSQVSIPSAVSAAASAPQGSPPGASKGLNFVMRHSLPIFISPVGEPPSPPQLQWKLRREGAQTSLEAANTGGTHAQLAELVFTDAAGHRTAVHQGLLGYVLPGATVRWPLKVPASTFVAPGHWQVMINGSITEQDIAPLDR